MEENERRNFHDKDRFGSLFACQTMYVDGVVEVLLVIGCHRCIFYAHLCTVFKILRCLQQLLSFWNLLFLSWSCKGLPLRDEKRQRISSTDLKRLSAWSQQDLHKGLRLDVLHFQSGTNLMASELEHQSWAKKNTTQGKQRMTLVTHLSRHCLLFVRDANLWSKWI